MKRVWGSIGVCIIAILLLMPTVILIVAEDGDRVSNKAMDPLIDLDPKQMVWMAGPRSGPSLFEADVPVRGTYLFADNDGAEWDDNGDGVNETHYLEAPLIVDLAANGFSPRKEILINARGEVHYMANVDWNLYWSGPAELWCVFSSSDAVLWQSEGNEVGPLKRVPGAIDAEQPFVTLQTFKGYPTDIPEDFKVPEEGTSIIIPQGAAYLIISGYGTKFTDNGGWIKVTIDKDSDEDGLWDSWEFQGIDYNKDGEVDLDLPMLGADWEHKDIFVEGDYMAVGAPDPGTISDVIDAFYRSKVSNPDGVMGINLHVLIDEVIPWQETIGFSAIISTDYYDLKDEYFGTVDERSNIDTINAKKMVYRYCIFADKLSISGINPRCPGVAEGILCDDFILAFGAFSNNNREYQAAVFMHELGHTLGLNHGGNVSVNFKPNYLSIMNYAYQYNNYVPTRPLDYSYGKCIDLDESSLDEFNGIGQAMPLVWRGPNSAKYLDPNGLSTDWETNGWIDNHTVRMNVNNFDNSSPANEILRDFNDWEGLVYNFRHSRLYTASATPDDYHIELTIDQIEEMNAEAVNIIVVDSPAVEDSDAGLPMEAVLGIVAVAAIVIVVAILFFMRKKKK